MHKISTKNMTRFRDILRVSNTTFRFLLASDIPLVMLQLFWAVIILRCVLMAVIAIVPSIAVAHTAVAPGLAHLLRCWLVARGEARAHQGSFPPGRSLVLK